MILAEDNLYPNDGTYINRRPAVQVEEQRKEKAKVVKEYPKIAEAIEELDEAIKHHTSIHAIGADVLANPDEFMHVVAGNKAAVAVLEGVKAKLEALLESIK